MSTLRITGALLGPAYTATGADGSSAWLILTLAQPGGTLGRVRQYYGNSFGAQYAASEAARRLKAGARVTVHAGSYRIQLLPEPHLVIEHVDLVQQLDLPPHHTERSKPRRSTRATAADFDVGAALRNAFPA